MYFFDKKTEYLVWKKEEGEQKGVGTIKFVVMDQVCRIEVSITSCAQLHGKYPIYILSADLKSLIGFVECVKGKGLFYIRTSTEQIGDCRIPYKEVTGVEINLESDGVLEKRWLPNHEVGPKKMEEKCEKLEPEPSKEKTKKPLEQMEVVQNKWQQLCNVYPIVHPFGDGRAYLSIEIKDFIVLQEKYYGLTQNSFLLHGFHHYRHVLLGRKTQGRYIQYYLGVPGVYYEREKAAAFYYGFEAFECASGRGTPGTFGYYLKQVQL